MTSNLEQFNEIFTENTELFKDLLERYSENFDNIEFHKENDGTGYAEFEVKAEFGYSLLYCIYNDGGAYINASKLVRHATWEEPEEYDEREYFYDNTSKDFNDLEEFLEEASSQFYF